MVRLLLMAFPHPGCTSRALDPGLLTHNRLVPIAPTYVDGLPHEGIFAILLEIVTDVEAAK